jgi:hypothetical protein
VVISADIQGAEGEMIRGGRHALERTHYLFTEYSDEEMYENQTTLREILDMLPGFRVLELWPDDVLLEREQIEEAIITLEPLARGRGKRRGRPPAGMTNIGRRGRPPGRKNKPKYA